jgi:hypothetical protein
MHVEEVGILHALLVFVAVALAAAGRPGGRAIDCLESLVLSRPGHTARTAQVAFCPVPAGAGRPVDRKTSQKLSLICWFPYRWCVAHQPPRARTLCSDGDGAGVEWWGQSNAEGRDCRTGGARATLTCCWLGPACQPVPAGLAPSLLLDSSHLSWLQKATEPAA